MIWPLVILLWRKGAMYPGFGPDEVTYVDALTQQMTGFPMHFPFLESPKVEIDRFQETTSKLINYDQLLGEVQCDSPSLGISLKIPSPFFPGILLSRKPPENSDRCLKRTMVERNGWNQPLEERKFSPGDIKSGCRADIYLQDGRLLGVPTRRTCPFMYPMDILGGHRFFGLWKGGEVFPWKSTGRFFLCLEPQGQEKLDVFQIRGFPSSEKVE